MNKCDYCGEEAKCKRIFGYSHYDFLALASCLGFDYICEKCNNAIEIKRKKIIAKENEEDRKAQAKWIKERDNILKEKIE